MTSDAAIVVLNPIDDLVDGLALVVGRGSGSSRFRGR